MKNVQSNCSYCGKFYTPHPRLGKRQKTCGREACKKELKRQNQARWREQNPACQKGRYPYVKAWREKNPDYQRQWRQKRREIQNSIQTITPIKSIRCLVPVNLLKNEIQNSILVLSPIDISTYKARTGT